MSTFDREIKLYARRGGRKEARKVTSLRAVRRLPPAHNEIIIATGVEFAGGVLHFGISPRACS